jgi:hypothetical protein
MIAIVLLFVRGLFDSFKSRRRLEAEFVVLRHQLNVLRKRAPSRLYLSCISRDSITRSDRRRPHQRTVRSIVEDPADIFPRNAAIAARLLWETFCQMRMRPWQTQAERT